MITRKDVALGDIFFKGVPLRFESDLKVDGEPCVFESAAPVS